MEVSRRFFNSAARFPARAAFLVLAAGSLAACDTTTKVFDFGATPQHALVGDDIHAAFADGDIQVVVPKNSTLISAILFLPDGTSVRADSVEIQNTTPINNNTVHMPGMLTAAGDQADRPPANAGDVPSVAMIHVPDTAAYAQEWQKAYINVSVGNYSVSQSLTIPAPNPGP